MAGMGIALIVMILFILFGFVDGMRRTVQGSAESGNYVLLALGAENEPNSFISYSALDVLKSRPEFATNDAGAPLLSPEVVGGLNVNPGNPRTMFVYIR